MGGLLNGRNGLPGRPTASAHLDRRCESVSCPARRPKRLDFQRVITIPEQESPPAQPWIEAIFDSGTDFDFFKIGMFWIQQKIDFAFAEQAR